MSLDSIYKYDSTPKSDEKAVIKGEKYRFTVLTSRLIRMEYSENGVFEDRATKIVSNRLFQVPEFEVVETDDTLYIMTECVKVTYHKNNRFSPSALTARYYGEYGDNTNTWRFKENERPYGGEPQTYFGTTTSLDLANGEVELDKGLMSWHFGDLDDSESLVINQDGWVEARSEGIEDTYLFAYRDDHIDCLYDYLKLSGKISMLPRYALGNWWCRYYAYSDKEYLELLDKFEEKQIPLSVAALDMDWHITEIDKKYGTGWTGYSFNKNLFPNPKEFLQELHNRGLAVTANLHDREGIAPHEENYEQIAKAVGINPSTKQKVEFDFGSPEFLNAYFKYTHHNNEDIGMDFWWEDGAPKNTSKFLKADIPWMTNHYSYLDNKRNGNRGMLLSRNSGWGGQRYGVGFSGDTYATWEMLRFLPYFTATSANAGFGWWSHDVGGFMQGERDDELMVRWLQFAVFSPILRLHSTNNSFMSKEPWNYNKSAEEIVISFLQLRAKLLPYIYTMNYYGYENNITLVRPLYYYSKSPYSHKNKNQYYFGNDMIVAPITEKINSQSFMAHTEVFLPEGLWFDFFSAKVYKGDRNYTVYRTLDEIPVFCKAGSIIPTCELRDSNINSIENPKTVVVNVFPGADGNFELYEDDGVTAEYEKGSFAKTNIQFKWSQKPQLKISKPLGDNSFVPDNRCYKIEFRKISDCDEFKVTADGKDIEFKKFYDGEKLTVIIKNVGNDKNIEIEFLKKVEILQNVTKKSLKDFLMYAQISNDGKQFMYNSYLKNQDRNSVMIEAASDKYSEDFKGAITEFLFSD